jgi:hypothetical protein
LASNGWGDLVRFEDRRVVDQDIEPAQLELTTWSIIPRTSSGLVISA